MVPRELISLFCGPGGLDLGFRLAGFVPRLAYDKDEACVETYNFNHGEYSSARIADLADLNIAERIIQQWQQISATHPVGVIGGPPCQSFSVSNVYPRETDQRHSLPEDYARILAKLNDAFKIDFFVFENVPGLETRKHSSRFAKFIELFENAGFRIFRDILDAQKYGVAQVRQRIFIVGLNRQKFPRLSFEFPKGECVRPKTVNEAIGHLPDPAYYRRDLKEEDIPYHRNHWCMVPRSDKFTNGSLEPGKRTGRSFRVLHNDRPSYAVAYGNREVHVHPNCMRRLSVFEAMLLQGFPERYVLKGSLSDQIRLVSEAVPPPVAQALAEALQKQLFLDSGLSLEHLQPEQSLNGLNNG